MRTRVADPPSADAPMVFRPPAPAPHVQMNAPSVTFEPEPRTTDPGARITAPPAIPRAMQQTVMIAHPAPKVPKAMLVLVAVLSAVAAFLAAMVVMLLMRR